MKKTADNQTEFRSIDISSLGITKKSLLGKALKTVIPDWGMIDANGNSFSQPNAAQFNATLYGTDGIETEVPAGTTAGKKHYFTFTGRNQDEDIPNGAVVGTEKATFRDELGNDKTEKHQIIMRGGWVWDDNEFKLVIYTPKNEDHNLNRNVYFTVDVPKLRGRMIYNAVSGYYITSAIFEHILKPKGFTTTSQSVDVNSSARTIFNENGGLSKLNQTSQNRETANPETDVKPGVKKTVALPAGMKPPPGQKVKAPEADPSKRKKPEISTKDANIYLYTPDTNVFSFKYPPDPANPTAPPPEVQFVVQPPYQEVKKIDGKTDDDPPKWSAVKSYPSTVSIKFSELPEDAPVEIYHRIKDYLVDGLGAQGAHEGHDVSFGQTKYNPQDFTTGGDEETLVDGLTAKAEQLEADIQQLIQRGKMLRVSIHDQYPVRQRRQDITDYVMDLDSFKSYLEGLLPKPLRKQEQDLRASHGKGFRKEDINLMQILKETT